MVLVIFSRVIITIDKNVDSCTELDVNIDGIINLYYLCLLTLISTLLEALPWFINGNSDVSTSTNLFTLLPTFPIMIKTLCSVNCVNKNIKIDPNSCSEQ